MSTLNSAADLDRSLGSLAAQTFRDFEVVLVDGGSADNTLEQAKLLLQASGLRFRLMLAPGTGIYEAINLGVAVAAGQWLYVMGSDDHLLAPDVFANLSGPLERPGQDAVLVHGNVWIEDPGYLYGQPWDLGRLMERNLSHQSAFYRHEVIRKHRIFYDTKYNLYADWDYNIRMMSLGRFVYVPLPVASYGCGGVSSFKKDLLFLEDRELNTMRYFGWRACWMMTPDRYALALARRPSAASALLGGLNRLYWSVRRLLKLA
jgi:glycosyltransferase involved in cell wall biosynthesis